MGNTASIEGGQHSNGQRKRGLKKTRAPLRRRASTSAIAVVKQGDHSFVSRGIPRQASTSVLWQEKGDTNPALRTTSRQASSSVATQATETDNSTSSSGSKIVEDGKSSTLAVVTKNGEIPKNAPAELRLVREWIRCKDWHDIEGMQEMTDMKNCMITFVDSETEMPAREFYGAMDDIYTSFPNLHFFWKSMHVTTNIDGLENNNCNAPSSLDGSVKVVIEDYYGIGTHTGKPYSFGPYPPVEPKGTFVRDENIEFTFWVKPVNRDGDDGHKELKIVKATVDAFGKMVGPPGFYTKIGGLIM